MSSKFFATLLIVACLGITVPAFQDQKPADKPPPGDEMIYKYLCAETDRLRAREFLGGATTLAEWQQKRPRLHQEYLDMLGLWPLPEKTPLKATVTGTLEHEGVVIDNLHFQSKPGLYVTANIYRPKDPPAKKLPAVLYVCGHSNKGRDGNKSAYQDHGMWFASNGYVCLVLDSLQLGEIPGVHHGTYGDPYRHVRARGDKDKEPGETRWWWHSAGYTPAGVECWNGVRAIDYLVTRPDVDGERIGVTGISGGGAATFWIAAADERVKVAVPVSGMSDLESYVKHKVINGHCDCMFLYNTYQWDWTTIAALVAPRPLLFANSDDDKIFPMDGNRRIMRKLRDVYALYKSDLLLDEYVSKGGHAYRPDLRVAGFKFLNKHLKGDADAPVKDADFKPIEGKRLRVFPTDDDIPKDALNGKIDETFVPRAQVELPKEGKFAEWKKGLIERLRGSVFRSLPQTIPMAKWLSKDLLSVIETEPGIANYTGGMEVKEGQLQSKFVILFVSDDDDADWFKKSPDLVDSLLAKALTHFLIARGGNSTVGLNPIPTLHWTKQSPPNFVERSHALLGRTADEGRVRDIIAALKLFDKAHEGKKSWIVMGRGKNGILAAYAALFEPLIKEVVIIDPPTSHMQGPHFLNVLRVLDIPEALGLLAPMPLTLVNANDAAFDRTAAIYKLAGAADKLKRK